VHGYKVAVVQSHEDALFELRRPLKEKLIKATGVCARALVQQARGLISKHEQHLAKPGSVLSDSGNDSQSLREANALLSQVVSLVTPFINHNQNSPPKEWNEMLLLASFYVDSVSFGKQKLSSKRILKA